MMIHVPNFELYTNDRCQGLCFPTVYYIGMALDLFLLNILRASPSTVWTVLCRMVWVFPGCTYVSPHDKTNKLACVPNEDSDQPEHPPSLIRALSAWRKLRSLATHWAHSEDSDLSLCWAHRSFCWFWHEVAQLSFCRFCHASAPEHLPCEERLVETKICLFSIL